MLLIERHVSAYSEAIIRFNNFQLYATNIFHGTCCVFDFLTVYLYVTHTTGMRQLKMSY